MTLIFALLLACSPAAHDHDHPHDGDEGHAHEAHGEEAHGHEAHGEEAHGHEAKPAQADSLEAAMGDHEARLEPTDTALTLTLLGPDGKPVAAAGEARVVLTGTGEAAQRVVLTGSGTSWTGPAKAAGAPGYLAVVSLDLNGTTQAARFTWGAAPEAAPAPVPHDHGEGGHDHGEAGHKH